MSGQYVWLLTAESTLEFYERAGSKEAITEKEREAILVQMCREGLIECLGHTEMTKDELFAELGKDLNVLRVEKREK